MQQAATRSFLAFKGRCMDVKFEISNSNYKPVEKIGTGAYGVVCSATNKKTGEKVAIKKIPNAFDELTTAKRTFRELKILRHFRHENIIAIREILMPKEPLIEMRDVYVVFDLMESDLHQIIHSNQPFSLEHIKFFLYQILRGLKYIHSADVIHRDLKPSNLLVNENCELRIGDFGMARGLSTMSKDKKRVFMTSYVATRWYRAPELLFSSDDYTLAVDVWSVGCILGEMVGRKQMFPGKNPIDQLSRIVDTLGMPPTHMLKTSNSDQLYNFFQKNFANKSAKDLSKLYPHAEPQALDLLAKMLIFEPSERITVNQALKHPFLDTYHTPDDEPDCFPKFDFSFENVEMTREQIKQQIGKMILKYNKPKGWVGKGLLSVVPKTPTTTSSSEMNATSGQLQTVGPSLDKTGLQTIGPASNPTPLRTIGPSNSRGVLPNFGHSDDSQGLLQTVGSSNNDRGIHQTVEPSSNNSGMLQTVGPSTNNRGMLQTVGPSSNSRGLLQTVGPSSNRSGMLQTVGPSTNNRGVLQTVGPANNSRGMLQTVGPANNNRGMLQTVGPANNSRGMLQTVGPANNSRGLLQTVGPSSNNRGMLQTVGPSSNSRGLLQTVGPSSKGTLQTVGPSSNRNSLQTVGPSSKSPVHQTVPSSMNRDPHSPINIEAKDGSGDSTSVSSGSPLISESLLSSFSPTSLLFDTSPKFVATDDSGDDLFKPVSPSDGIKFEQKPKVEDTLQCAFLDLPDITSSMGNMGDVEMPSAKSTSGDSMASFLLSASKMPSQPKQDNQSTSLLVSSDIEMRSAKGEAVPLIGVQETENDVKQTAIEFPDENASDASSSTDADSHRDRSNSSGQKTISEDTKALIKAALKNSALRNQKRDRLDSSSSEQGKGGGKMPVTALSRQREREEKRKQKMRRSLKKKKSKNKEAKQETTVLLTEDDKNMLERWNRMQQNKDKEGQKKTATNVQFGATGGGLGLCNPQSPAAQQETGVGNPSSTTNITKQQPKVVVRFQSTLPADAGLPNSRKNARSPIILEDSPKFGATTDLDSGSFFDQISSLNESDYPQSPDFLSQLDLPSGNTLFASSFSMSLGTTSVQGQGVSVQSSMSIDNTIGNQQEPKFEPAIPTTSPQTMPFMPMYVSTSSRNRSNSDVFLSPSPHSPKQQLLYRSPADRETPSPPTHIPSPPSCLQQSPPDYSVASKNNNPVNPSQSAALRMHPTGIGALRHDLPSGRRQRNSMSSDISTIIRQLSRSVVEDPLPSLLSGPLPITPKGDGGGYGLSLDIEELMSGSLVNDVPVGDGNKCDSAPLSASLLSDWLEVRNLDPEDMKAIEQDVHNLTTENLRELQRELGLTSPVGIPSIPELRSTSQADKDT